MAKKAPAASRKAPAPKTPAKPVKPTKSVAAKPAAPKKSAPPAPAPKPAGKVSGKAPVPAKVTPEKPAAEKVAVAKDLPAKDATAKGPLSKAAVAKGGDAKSVPVKTVEAKAGKKQPAGKVAPVDEAAPKKPAATLAQAPAGTVASKGAETPAPAAKAANPNQPPRPIKRPKAPPPVTQMPPGMGRLMDPKNPIRKPLIPSGPKAQAMRPLGAHGMESVEVVKVEGKSPLSKRELERFRAMLIKKRAELVGDVNTMENEALRGQSGALSNSPNHMAEQGSEAYDQALSLDLAAADRKLIREIDDALQRIKDGTYGLCLMTGNPIKPDRLEELPWARYSIEAARELERQAMRS